MTTSVPQPKEGRRMMTDNPQPITSAELDKWEHIANVRELADNYMVFYAMAVEALPRLIAAQRLAQRAIQEKPKIYRRAYEYHRTDGHCNE